MNTATWELLPTVGALRLTLSMDFEVLAITRTDANGTATVRLRDDVLPSILSPLIVEDFEASAGPVSYTISGDVESHTMPAVMVLDSPWLSVPIMQTYSQRVESVLEYGAELAGRASVIEFPGRRDVVAVLRKMALRRGTMQLWAGDYAGAASIRGVLSRGEIVMLRQPDHAGMDMYFITESASIDPLTTESGASIWAVSVTYIEVLRPGGFLASAPGWDFAQLAAAYQDFQAVAITFADFQSLALNEPTP